jgi:hypothetical protein
MSKLDRILIPPTCSEVLFGTGSFARFRVRPGIGHEREGAAARAATQALLPRLRAVGVDRVVVSAADSAKAAALRSGALAPADVLAELRRSTTAVAGGVILALQRLDPLRGCAWSLGYCDEAGGGIWVDFFSRTGSN